MGGGLKVRRDEKLRVCLVPLLWTISCCGPIGDRLCLIMQLDSIRAALKALRRAERRTEKIQDCNQVVNWLCQTKDSTEKTLRYQVCKRSVVEPQDTGDSKNNPL